MQKLLEIGLSGWIPFVITLLFGSGIVLWQVTRRKTRQLNIKAGGDVAGGDIHKGIEKENIERISSKEVSTSNQKNIVTGGDVSGGNIYKQCK